jgi:hypothetical protein
MRIVTTLDHTASGRPVIIAKSEGRQKTTNYDHGKSHDRNHGEAAANLILHMWKQNHLQGSEVKGLAIRAESGTHTTENGAKHVFVL